MTILIGFLAQGCFSARVLVQWLLSERAHRVLSPTVFWVLSLVGSYLFCLYGWLRGDFAIVLGQVVAYYVYLWNLRVKGATRLLPRPLVWLLVLTPVVAALVAALHIGQVVATLLTRSGVPLWLVIYGSVGQLLFTLRFVYQYLYSRRRGESVLPAGFWIISLTGAALILSYGVMRGDIVLIVGQGTGLCAYARNLWMIVRH